jgi:uncharacterized protein YecT (DUF1311 family)
MGDQPSLLTKRPLGPDFAPAELNGTFYGLDDELLRAPYRAALSAAAAVNLVASPLVAPLGREAQDRWFAAMVDTPLRTLEELDERSAINGTGARIVGELGRIAALAPLGPVGLGAVEAASQAGREVRAGSEHPIALGAVRGATLAVGFALPLTLPVRPGWGPALLQRLGYGVGSNVALGAAQRGAEGALGEDAEVMDKLALTLDAALGAFFGGAAHVYGKMTGEAADAAMTMIEQASAQRIVPPDAVSPQPFLNAAAEAQKSVAGESTDAMLNRVYRQLLAELEPEQYRSLLQRENVARLAERQRQVKEAVSRPFEDLPSIWRAAAKQVDDQATAAEALFREADPALAQAEVAGAGKPEALPQVEATKPKAPKADQPAAEATAWAPINEDGDAAAIDLPALQQSAAQLDALGVKREDGRAWSQALDEAAAAPADAATLLDDVSRCIIGYGH